MKPEDGNFVRFYHSTANAVADVTKRAGDTPDGHAMSSFDLSAALVSACLRATALILATEPEIDPDVFDGELERHLTTVQKYAAACRGGAGGREWR